MWTNRSLGPPHVRPTRLSPLSALDSPLAGLKATGGLGLSGTDRARRDSHPGWRAHARPASVARIGPVPRNRHLPGPRRPVRPPYGFSPETPRTAPVPGAAITALAHRMAPPVYGLLRPKDGCSRCFHSTRNVAPASAAVLPEPVILSDPATNRAKAVRTAAPKSRASVASPVSAPRRHRSGCPPGSTGNPRTGRRAPHTSASVEVEPPGVGDARCGLAVAAHPGHGGVTSVEEATTTWAGNTSSSLIPTQYQPGTTKGAGVARPRRPLGRADSRCPEAAERMARGPCLRAGGLPKPFWRGAPCGTNSAPCHGVGFTLLQRTSS